ncbi:hypothetical protein PR048_031971 [Dryococelus australis]|uniref:Uncharacterized protein n=1 Tax=Dryococelus australis TaxID=614101 RepID=A0ABQ9G6U0_9NEOP|nr:hypothetical protein PR048_031971 [Dryococelus australis]
MSQEYLFLLLVTWMMFVKSSKQTLKLEVIVTKMMIVMHHSFSQSELNDLVRDLDLPQQSVELFGLRLKEKKLVSPRDVVFMV